MLKTLRSKLTLKRMALAIALLLFVVAGASAAIPGPHRALCPACFGMDEIAPGIYADTTDQVKIETALAQLEDSHEQMAHYLGGRLSNPRILLCFETACQDLFGNEGPRGISWGKDLIRLNPKGLNPAIMRHELFHTELHARMGFWGMWNDDIPRWFNEGLAVHLSGDPRFNRIYSTQEEAFARSIKTLSDWRREINEDTWEVAYGAGAQMVREIEGKVGRDGIRALIRRVTENGEDFESVLADIML